MSPNELERLAGLRRWRAQLVTAIGLSEEQLRAFMRAHPNLEDQITICESVEALFAQECGAISIAEPQRTIH